MSFLGLHEPTTLQAVMYVLLALGAFFLLRLFMSAMQEGGSRVNDISWGGRQLGFFERDARRAKRKNCRIPVFVNDRFNIEPNSPGHVLNISDTGACISTYANLYLGSHLISKLANTRPDQSYLEGEVVWVRPEGHTTTYGVRFR